jgi:hypothetical protein
MIDNRKWSKTKHRACIHIEVLIIARETAKEISTSRSFIVYYMISKKQKKFQFQICSFSCNTLSHLHILITFHSLDIYNII